MNALQKAKEKEKIPNQRLEESKRKRKILDQRSEEGRSKICRKVIGPDDVWIMYRIVNKQERKEKKPWLEAHKSPLVVTNQIFVPASLSRRAKHKKKNKKRKRPKHPKSKPPTKAKLPTKHTIPKKVLLIHDCACYLWFDRKWFAKSSHDISIVQNYDETFSRVRFIHFEQFSSISVGSNVSSKWSFRSEMQ